MEPPEAPDDQPEPRAAASVSPATLMRMATAYLARYAASRARLREVLERKVRRRCEARDLPVPDAAEVRALVDATVERLVRAGLLDDEAYARGRAAALARKGWPAWRIRTELERKGLASDDRDLSEAVPQDEDAQARRFAERKRLGPFRMREREAHREKDIARMARAGFSTAVAKKIIGDS